MDVVCSYYWLLLSNRFGEFVEVDGGERDVLASCVSELPFNVQNENRSGEELLFDQVKHGEKRITIFVSRILINV
jgi:hypothetical protein